MADDVNYPGRLIAVDGSRGKDTTAGADAIVDALRQAGIECAISRWDASGLFGELTSAAREDCNLSIRTLALVYAADLAFRLRWEIRPVLAAGGVVVAAPYVDTAIAFGASYGLSEEWTRQLMDFAPAPDLRGRAEERKIDRAWKRSLERGYPEYAAVMLEGSAPNGSKLARREVMRLLDQAKGRKIVRLVDDGAAAIARAVTGSRRAESSRSASRPRTARK
jgi:thymidylate kinase